jgi:DNA-binding LytR/AlgR family response regulator
MIRAIVVDDEELGRKRLKRLLEDHPDVEVVAEAPDGAAARAEVFRVRPDLLFLDVQMPGEDGPTALRSLRATLPEGHLPIVVFTTAYSEHALDAFELEAIDYLLKPIERERLARALKRVRKQIWQRVPQPSPPAVAPPPPPAPGPEPSPTHLMARRGTRVVPLDLDNVAAIVVEDTITWALTRGGRFRVPGGLAEVRERLPEGEFLQVSRSALLRPSAIAELRPLASGTLEAVLKDVDDVVHVSRRRGRDLKRLLGW